MKVTGNTILITGGGSGIGRALVEAFHTIGNQVIISGRREHILKETAIAHPGMAYRVLDQDHPDQIREMAGELRERFPKLNVLINNAGIQRMEDLTSSDTFEAEATIQTNQLGPIRMTAALVHHLMSQPRSAILNVSSALAMVAAAMLPTYCATKAAIHSYTQSLRFQLRNSTGQVIEILPLWVQTELQGNRGMNPKAMPLADFISETMTLLKAFPRATEVVSERARPMRYAERGDYESFYSQYNEGWATSQKR